MRIAALAVILLTAFGAVAIGRQATAVVTSTFVTSGMIMTTLGNRAASVSTTLDRPQPLRQPSALAPGI